MPDIKPLGQELLDVVDDISVLIRKAPDKEAVKELVAQQMALRNQIAELIDASLDQASDEYREAAVGIQQASGAIRKSMSSIQDVVDTINCIARAVKLVGKLL